MIKYSLLGLFVIAALTMAFVFYQKSQPPSPAEKHREWRRTAMEEEYTNRPAEYVEMKAAPTVSGEDLRMPASKK